MSVDSAELINERRRRLGRRLEREMSVDSAELIKERRRRLGRRWSGK